MIQTHNKFLEFLTFEKFITQDILIFFYYIGVFFLPVLLWYYRKKVTFLYNAYTSDKKGLILLIAFIIFLFMQMMWRMMFEAMIGYFDMHNYLHDIAIHIKELS
jgi:hypothetical protein